jgi:hypothetical protein
MAFPTQFPAPFAAVVPTNPLPGPGTLIAWWSFSYASTGALPRLPLGTPVLTGKRRRMVTQFFIWPKPWSTPGGGGG